MARDMTGEQNFFWLVGLLEGEGSFLKPSPSKPNEPKVDIEMKDLDAIRRVAALFGVTYRVRDRHRENTSITYHVRLAGTRAVQLMWAVRPYVCVRRREQIDRAVAHFASRGKKYEPSHMTPFALRPVCATVLCAEPPAAATGYCEGCAPQLELEALG